MNRTFILFTILIFLLACISCQQKVKKENHFNDKIFLLENNPQLYLSKLDTSKINNIRNEKEATNFLLTSLAMNYINDSYPKKNLLLKSIQIFQQRKLIHQQLKSLLLLAKIYKQEDNLNKEVEIIKEAINIAEKEDEKEQLYYLYSYLGEMYIREYNMMNFIKYQTLANQYIKDFPFQEMNISTQIQVAKSFLYIEQYKKSYELLDSIEISISKNNIHYNEIKRLQGIVLFKTMQWKQCIEKIQEVLTLKQTEEHKFICYSILTYCYYLTNDLTNAKKYKKLAMSYDIDTKTNFTEIEFYKLCSKFAKENNELESQLDCLYKTIERYENILTKLNGQSLDKAIQAYTHICERKDYEKKISTYQYGLIGLIFTISVGFLTYFNKKKKQAYRLVALQQQIQALENLKSVKDEAKLFILRDFEVAKQIAMLRYTQKEQSAKLLKEIEKFNFIKYNDLLTTQWNSFYKHIDLSFDNFYSMLKENHSCLNEKEMQLCCMLIAGFKTEEIAAIWMQSIFSVHKYKTNIRKKIKAPDGANIISFLSQKNEIQ